MALATQCPHCRTTFRVAHDQLKLRAGLVRCGSCKEIFNGIEHLLPSEAVAATQTPHPVDVATAPVPAPTVHTEPPATPTTKPIVASPKSAASGSAPSVSAAQASPAAPVSPELDFAYPDVEPEANPPIADTVLETRTDEPVEVEFVEVPRKNPLPPPAAAEPAHPFAEPPAHAFAAAASVTPAPSDPLQRMTLVDLSDESEIQQAESKETNVAPQPDPLDGVMEEFERRPMRGGKKKSRPHVRSPIVTMQEEVPVQTPQTAEPEAETDSESESISNAEETDSHDEPEFVKRERKKKSLGRGLRIAMSVMSMVLLLTGLGQAAYSFRDQIAARVPEAKPVLQDACTYLGCKINLPAQIESFVVESPQLEALATRKDTWELSVVLRNAGSTAQTWPLLELTLNDAANNPIARRIFAPQEYLPATTDVQKGIGANAEQPIKVYFEYSDSKPSGIYVYAFYR